MAQRAARRGRPVLYLTAHHDLAGGERCLLELLALLDRDEFRPIVLVPREGRLASELRERGVDTRVWNLGVLNNKRELYSPRLVLRLLALSLAVVRLASLIRAERVALVHSNTSAVLAGALAARLTRVPHVWHVREILIRPSWLWTILQRVILSCSARVICMSTAIRERFNPRLAGADKVVVIHDGIDLASFTPLWADGDRTSNGDYDGVESGPRIGMLARINPWKGQEVFVEAARLVGEQNRQAQFLIAGDALPVYRELRTRLEELIQARGLAGRVHLVGDLTRRQAAAFIQQLDILVIPSTSPEPFGLTALEGMAFGKPVIASDAGGPRDVVISGVTGLLVPVGDPEALARAIVRLLEDESYRDSLGRAGRRRVAERFDGRSSVTRIEGIYRVLVRR
jgi:glycosyltransferase involved in cell wall biosynthesis